MMKRVVAMGVAGVFSTCLFAQGLSTTQTKDQWEEINFEFNSSILSDGYPSLLRLAEILHQHPDYRVKVVGNTDFVGSARYNDRLAERRAETVRDFLVKYGASAGQITTSGEGKRDPTASNKTKEGRFMNRRVVMTVTDGQGKVIADGGVSEVMPTLADLLKQQQECCAQILKRLDKLDDILAALRDLKGENDRLKGQVAELQSAQKDLEAKVNGLPKPLSAAETEAIAKKEGEEALNEAARRNKKFSLLGLDVGPTAGGNRPTGDVVVNGSGQFFSPFGGDGRHAVQAQGEYTRYPGLQEGQFDIGLVNRWSHVQAGIFSSFKYIRLGQFQSGGGMGQAAFVVDYLFSRGRIGLYGTEGFKSTGALAMTPLGPTSFIETYARPMNQIGGSAQFGVWGDAWIQLNGGYIHSRTAQSNRGGGEIKLVQPLSREFAFTVRAAVNPNFITSVNTGEVTFGLLFGNFMRPKEYTSFDHPVPMDIPRIRYELLTRRVGHSAPVADAGPAQIGVPPGTVTLNGSGSYSPDHDPISFQWTQVSGPSVAISGANTATATFTAAPSTSYGFRLTVTDTTTGLTASANTSVSTRAAFKVLRFSATPSQISAGQTSIIQWNVPGATSVNITNIGNNLNPSGSATVSPTTTTAYTLTATGPGGQSVSQSLTITVGASTPSVVRFTAAPTTISSGQSATLSWATTGVKSVSISSGVGTNLAANGSITVSPTSTTTYTLTATGADGVTTVTAAVTVTVSTPAAASVQILTFSASPAFSPVSGSPVVLSWTTANASYVIVTGTGVPGGQLQANGSLTVYPTTNSDYTLTAYGNGGSVSSVIHVFVR